MVQEAIESPAPQELNPEYAARILFHSFRHSQGNQYLQKLIISYIHTTRPSWMVEEKDKSVISFELRKLLASYDKMRQQGVHASGTVATSPHGTDQATERVLYLTRFLNQDNEPKSVIIKDVTHGIINQDYLFLTRPLGRNKQNSDIHSPLHDNWLSHAVLFGLNGKPTGLTEFDEMYRDAKAFILSGTLDQESRGKFEQVLNIYREKHPGFEINLQP